mgnify:CR=1 FL=1
MADTFMGNCYKIYCNNRLVAVVPNEIAADLYIRNMCKCFDWYMAKDFTVELAFIEGIGF